MKIKTSISLSKDLLCRIDEAVGEGGNRSEFIERVVRQHLRRAERDASFTAEVALLNRIARGEGGIEPPDVLDYTVEPEQVQEPVQLA
jgi:metal-responsive CopG/Arc/MetJ family transcriptional regulator